MRKWFLDFYHALEAELFNILNENSMYFVQMFGTFYLREIFFVTFFASVAILIPLQVDKCSGTYVYVSFEHFSTSLVFFVAKWTTIQEHTAGVGHTLISFILRMNHFVHFVKISVGEVFFTILTGKPFVRKHFQAFQLTHHLNGLILRCCTLI